MAKAPAQSIRILVKAGPRGPSPLLVLSSIFLSGRELERERDERATERKERDLVATPSASRVKVTRELWGGEILRRRQAVGEGLIVENGVLRASELHCLAKE